MKIQISIAIKLFFLLASSVYSKDVISVNISGIPNLIYADELRYITVEISSISKPVKAYHIGYSLQGDNFRFTPDSRIFYSDGHIDSDKSTYNIKAVIPFIITPHPKSKIELNITITGGALSSPIYKTISIIPLSRINDKINLLHGQYWDKSNNRVIICNKRIHWTKHREWQLLKKSREWYTRKSSPAAYIGFPINNIDVPSLIPFYKLIRGMKVLHIPLQGMDGDYSILWIPLKIRKAIKEIESTNFLIHLPIQDINNRLSNEDIIRAIDAIDRIIKSERPGSVITVMTPFPLVAEEEVSKRYANAVHDAARECHLNLIDIHEHIIQRHDWYKLYTTDSIVYYPYPLQQGQRLASTKIADILKQYVKVD